MGMIEKPAHLPEQTVYLLPGIRGPEFPRRTETLTEEIVVYHFLACKLVLVHGLRSRMKIIHPFYMVLKHFIYFIVIMFLNLN